MDLNLLTKPGKESLKTKPVFSVPETIIYKRMCLLRTLNLLINLKIHNKKSSFQGQNRCGLGDPVAIHSLSENPPSFSVRQCLKLFKFLWQF